MASAWGMVRGNPSNRKPLAQSAWAMRSLTRLMIRSSLTSWPASITALACWPRGVPALTAARSMSPVEIWGMPYFWQMKAACVPLPAPGAPNKISFMEVLEESRNSCLPDRPTGADSPCVIFLSRARIARTGLTLAYTQRAKLSPVQSPKTAFCCPTKPHVQLCCEWRCRASPLAHLYWRMRDRIQADNRARTRSRSSGVSTPGPGA